KIIYKLKDSNFLFKFYKNSDIKKFTTCNLTSKYIIYSSKTNNAYNNSIIKDHLDKFKSILIKIREINNEQIDLFPYLRRGTSNENIFISPKIVAPQRSPKNTFGYNEVPWYASADVYFITQKDENVSLKYILALL